MIEVNVLSFLATFLAIASVMQTGGVNLFDGLGVSLVQLLAQVVNFLLLMLLLNGLIIRPILRNLEARRKRIEESLENARLADERLADIEKERQVRLNELAAEAQKMRADILEDARQEAARMRAEAQVELERARRQARVDAEAERNRILAESRNQIVALVMAATNKLIGDSLDAKRQKALINDFFSKLPAAGIASVAVNSVPIKVTSALPLTRDEQTKVKTELSRRIGAIDEIIFEVDPNILGGLVVRVGDQVIDGSVSSKINAIHRQLSAPKP